MKRRQLIKNGMTGLLAFSFLPKKPIQTMTNYPIEQLLLQRYPGIRRNIQQSIYDKMEEADLRKMPNGMNSIAWNIWHMARAEDVGINRLVSENIQIFDKGNYMERMNINIRHFGTGMNKEESKDLSEKIDISALREYHEAVGEQSLKVFSQIDQIKLDEKLDQDHLHRVMIDEGVLHENALWVEAFYQTKIRSWFLVHMGLTHSFEHLGQLMLIRKLLGYEGTR